MKKIVGTMLCTLVFTVNAAAYTFRTIDVEFPGIKNAAVTGLTTEGTILGTYTDTASNNHGFLRNPGKRSDRAGADIPLLNVTPTAINTQEQILGAYGDGQGFSGFLFARGTFERFRVPRVTSFSSPLLTEPQGINDSGIVVGDFRAEDGTFQGFLYNTTTRTFQRFMAPGATMTTFTALSDHGIVVGSLRDASGKMHAFRGMPGQYDIVTVQGFIDIDLVGVTDSGLLAGNVGSVGFVYDGNEIDMIEVPGALTTDLLGMRADGTIYGTFQDTQGVYHGFVGSPERHVVRMNMQKATTPFGQQDCISGSKRSLCRGR